MINLAKFRSKFITAVIVLFLILILSPFIRYSPKENPALQKTLHHLRDVQGILNSFKAVCGRYPNTSLELNSLIGGSNLGCEKYQATKNLDMSCLSDGWGEALIYSSDGGTFSLKVKGNEDLHVTDKLTVFGKPLSK